MCYKSLYHKRKAQHKCTGCGKVTPRTLSGRATCEQCAKNDKERKRAYSAKYRVQHIEETRVAVALRSYISYHNRQESRKCVSCGAKLPEDYYFVRCNACRERQKVYRKKKKNA